MLRLLADENFDGNIVRGLMRRLPGLNVVRVQDVGLSGETDAVILKWAAEQGRIVLTHDVGTFPKHAVERVQQGLPMPGVFAIPCIAPIGQVISDLHLLTECSSSSEWEGQVMFLPL
jgi:hypothetical protein